MTKEQLALILGALLLLASLILNWRARSSDAKFFSWLLNMLSFSLLTFAGASKVGLVLFFRQQNFIVPFVGLLCILAGILAVPTGMAIRGLRSKLIRTPD